MLDEFEIDYELINYVINEDLDKLLAKTHLLRNSKHGNKIYQCAIINAKSGRCPENCAYCAQSVHYNTNITEYNLLSNDQIFSSATKAFDNGATQFSIVTSGRDITFEELERLEPVICKIKEKTNLRLCASFGLLSKQLADKLKIIGFDRYHHNIETSPTFFPSICSSHDFEDSVITIKNAKEAELEVCCGGIIGMGESWEQRYEMAKYISMLDINAIPLNFLNPIANTPLEKQALLDPEEALRVVSLFRVINPDINICIAGGREKTLKHLQDKIFQAGANGIMIGDYLTTTGRSIDEDKQMIRDQGLVTYGI